MHGELHIVGQVAHIDRSGDFGSVNLSNASTLFQVIDSLLQSVNVTQNTSAGSITSTGSADLSLNGVHIGLLGIVSRELSTELLRISGHGSTIRHSSLVSLTLDVVSSRSGAIGTILPDDNLALSVVGSQVSSVDSVSDAIAIQSSGSTRDTRPGHTGSSTCSVLGEGSLRSASAQLGIIRDIPQQASVSILNGIAVLDLIGGQSQTSSSIVSHVHTLQSTRRQIGNRDYAIDLGSIVGSGNVRLVSDLVRIEGQIALLRNIEPLGQSDSRIDIGSGAGGLTLNRIPGQSGNIRLIEGHTSNGLVRLNDIQSIGVTGLNGQGLTGISEIGVLGDVSLSGSGGLEDHLRADLLNSTVGTDNRQSYVLVNAVVICITVGDRHQLTGVTVGTSLLDIGSEVGKSIPQAGIVQRILTITVEVCQRIKQKLSLVGHSRIVSHNSIHSFP